MSGRRVASAPRVLVVDDDAAARELFTLILRAAGCEVTSAADGWTALQWVTGAVGTRQLPDVVVLDLDMPYLNGDAFLSAKARHPTLIAVPVIIVTAKPDAPLTTTAFALLEKPIISSELVDAVRAAARRTAPVPAL